MPDLSQVSGVGVAALAVYFFYKLASNHIDHNTNAINALTEVIKELKDYLQNQK